MVLEDRLDMRAFTGAKVDPVWAYYADVSREVEVTD